MTMENSASADCWPPAGEPFEVVSVDLSVLPGPHPLYVAHRAAVEQNWQREITANPHLFDGPMVLQHRLSIDGGVIVGEAHEIPFSMFMWWRRQADPRGAFHVFGFAVPVSSDGAIVAVKMGDHTANPGQVYCAAGSLDRSDIVDGKLDLAGNMRREVREETGLDLHEAVADSRLFGVYSGARLLIYRFYRFGATADELIARIRNHMRDAEDEEIADAVAIRSADRGAQYYNPTMYPILDMFFAADGR